MRRIIKTGVVEEEDCKWIWGSRVGLKRVLFEEKGFDRLRSVAYGSDFLAERGPIVTSQMRDTRRMGGDERERKKKQKGLKGRNCFNCQVLCLRMDDGGCYEIATVGVLGCEEHCGD